MGKKSEKVSTNTRTNPDSRPFGPGQPSRTSIAVAAMRAFGSREPDESVRNPDWLAERMVTPQELDLIADHPIARALRQGYQESRRIREVAGMSNLLLVRTRYIDERLLRAVQNGVSQVVVLGAGFDTRAYRFRDQLKGKRIFELDYPSTQEIKKRRLREVFGSLPEHVCFTEIDFKTDSLSEVLRKAGYRDNEKTFFIWEGVSMYLPEPAVRSTLNVISKSAAPGSSLVMDFAESAGIQLVTRFPNLSQHKYTTGWGEPWIFGVPDMREREFFQECGFDVRDILGLFSREARKRYLRRADGTSLGTTRGGSPTSRVLPTMMRVLWLALTHRSRWYAVADLVVS